MTSSLTELRPPPTYSSPPPTPTRKQPPSGWYWSPASWPFWASRQPSSGGAVGTISAMDRVDSFERTTVPGAMTVRVTDPGTMVVYDEGPAELARNADPTATGRPAIPYNPATDATTEVRYVATTPTWQQLRLTVTGPDGAAAVLLAIVTYRARSRSTASPQR